MCARISLSPYNFFIDYKRMSNLSMGLCGKLARSIVWNTFPPLDSDLSTGLSYPLFEQLGPVFLKFEQSFEINMSVLIIANEISEFP